MPAQKANYILCKHHNVCFFAMKEFLMDTINKQNI